MNLDELIAVPMPGQPAVSPDGSTVVYVLTDADRDADRAVTSLWRVSAEGGEPERLTSGPGDSAPAWSPDGRTIAFVRAGDGVPQIWLLPVAGGEPRVLTELRSGAGAAEWSPDGTRLAFAAVVDTWASEPDEDAAARDHRAHAPIVIDRLGHKADGSGLLRGLRTHVHVVDVATGRTRQVTTGDFNVGSPAWSPDGTQLAFPAATTPDADLTGASEVYTVDLVALDPEAPTDPGAGEDAERDIAANLRCVGVRGGQSGPVTWYPDGEAILVVGREDTRTGHARLLRLTVASGEVRDVAADLDRNVMPGGPGYPGGLPMITSRGVIVFCARDRGCTHVYEVPADGDPTRTVLGGPERSVSGLSVTPDGATAIMVVADPATFGDVVVTDLTSGTSRPVTAYTPVGCDIVAPESRTFAISDGTAVHGWLIRDPDAATPAPLLIDVHGGPHNAWNPVADTAHGYHQQLVARGWSVLLVNPRGSDGYGEAFFTAAIGGWGVADQADFLEPVDALIAEGIADPERLAVSGYSYGGYMTCWLTGHTDRFAAAVAGGVVADLTSTAGTSDAGHLLVATETGALPHEDPAAVERQSPLAFVADVTTPTLILHGLADDRCPAGQAEQWFAALRARGIPAQLVFYPDASHLFILNGRPSHRVDYSRRIVDWVVAHADPKKEGDNDEHTGS